MPKSAAPWLTSRSSVRSAAPGLQHTTTGGSRYVERLRAVGPSRRRRRGATVGCCKPQAEDLDQAVASTLRRVACRASQWRSNQPARAGRSSRCHATGDLQAGALRSPTSVDAAPISGSARCTPRTRRSVPNAVGASRDPRARLPARSAARWSSVRSMPVFVAVCGVLRWRTWCVRVVVRIATSRR